MVSRVLFPGLLTGCTSRPPGGGPRRSRGTCIPTQATTVGGEAPGARWPPRHHGEKVLCRPGPRAGVSVTGSD